MTQLNPIPFEATHPGVLLKDEMNARKIRQNDLSFELGVQPTYLNEILKGKRSITADFAILLEKVLSIPADYLMQFQTQYDIDKARIKMKNIQRVEQIETWKIIKEYVPVRQLKNRGYLDEDLVKNISIIKDIYGFSSLDSLVNTIAQHNASSFYRKSEKLAIDKTNMLAWSKLAQFESRKVETGSFDTGNFQELMHEMKEIFFLNNDIKNKIRVKLAEFGIKTVYLEKFDQTPVDGFSFWSNENPAIALTLRHKRIDNFAFTLFHELGHIFLHLVNEKDRQFVDFDSVEEKDLFEIQADEFAQNILISEQQWSEIKNEFPITDQKIIEFATKYSINPAIVLGRICWEKGNYNIKSGIDRTLR